MMHKRWKRHALLAAVLVLPVVTAGCSLFSKQTSQPIDPPQVEMTDGEGSEPTGLADPTGESATITVYLQDGNGYLAPVAVPVTLGEGEKPGKRALEMMVEGGSYSSVLPADFRAMIPQGTRVLSYDIDEPQKLAKVNFSGEFAQYNEMDERAMLEAITWTLTATGVKGVELYLDGERLTEMPLAGYPMDAALTRAMGINVETADGVEVTNSSPVTLYFSAQTMNDEQYYVPVTRLVSRSDSPALAAMEELIAGPLNQKALSSVILPNVEVAGIEEKEGVLTVDLQDEAYEPGVQVPAEMLEAVVLSLTESTSASEVQISLNGHTDILADNNKAYNEPVGRPHHVNAFES